MGRDTDTRPRGGRDVEMGCDADTGPAMLTRSYLCNLVYRMTRWKHDGVYARVCEWAGVAQAPGT